VGEQGFYNKFYCKNFLRHSDRKRGIMGINMNELPPDVKRKIANKAGISREQILRVAADVMKV
jgi:hypothetical protein